MLRSVDHYTTLAAREAREGGERWILLKLATLPAWKFLETYVFRQGFRDGYPGLMIAIMAGYYVCGKYEKLRRMARDGQGTVEAAGR
jgi:hypothetical protein